jgi:hypothetical protein
MNDASQKLMNPKRSGTPFFNCEHLIQGAQILALVFAMLGTAFCGVDEMGLRRVRPTTLDWIFVGLGLSVSVGILSKRWIAGLRPFILRVTLGLLYLAITWLSARLS